MIQRARQLVVLAVLLATAIAIEAVETTAITSSGIDPQDPSVAIMTIGDLALGLARIERSDSSVRGAILYTAGSGNHIVLTDSIAPGHLAGEIINGAAAGSWGHFADAFASGGSIKGAFSITFAGPDTGVGTASKKLFAGASATSYSAGETAVQAAQNLPVDIVRETHGITTSGGFDKGGAPNGSNLFDSRVLILTEDSFRAAGLSLPFETAVAIAVGNSRDSATLSAFSSESRAIIGVYNLERDTFLSINAVIAESTTGVDTSIFVTRTARFDTGTNYIYFLFKGGDTRFSAFKDDAFSTSDSIGYLLATVVITDSDGSVKAGPTSGAGLSVGDNSIASALIVTTSGVTVTSTISRSGPLSSLRVQADSGSPSFETLDTSFTDFILFDASGNPLEDLRPHGGTARLRITFSGNDSIAARQPNFTLLRLNRVTGVWENFNAENGLISGPSMVEVSSENNRVIWSVTVDRVDGLGVIGAIGPAPGLPGASTGDCVIHSAVGGSCSSWMPTLRKWRDVWLGNVIGRGAVAAYYGLSRLILLVTG